MNETVSAGLLNYIRKAHEEKVFSFGPRAE